MTPDPKDSLDREIADALDGVDLQSLDREETPDRASAGGEKLWKGVIAGVSADDIIVELGPRMQGVVSAREFEEPPKVGEVHRFVVRGREDDLWLLSMTEAKELAAWDDLQPGSHVRARVSGQNQGGLELKIGKHDAFMPLSQVSLDREFDAASLMGQTITCEVVEVDRSRRRCVLSRRRIEEGERSEAQKESLGKLHTGLVLSGKVTRIEPFGAFVDLGGGLEGLVHVSNIARSRVEDPNDVLEKGQEVQVKVLDIKEGGKRIGLGIKQLEPDPWDGVEDRYHSDAVVTGKVTRLTDFGAFVELEPGLEGLLHVSKMGPERVRRPGDVVKMGEEVSIRVESIDSAGRRLSLSRLDPRGAVIGSEDSVASADIDDVLSRSDGEGLKTNLGSLFKKALDGKKP